ncbi:MAG: alpha/beta hydrolase [Acidobacteriota bacterium]|nr:alpha/beta hydrolase [Acidobacteriota bacterium]
MGADDHIVETSPVLDHVVQKMLDRLAVAKSPPVDDLTPEGARCALLSAQSGDVDRPHAFIEDRIVHSGNCILRLRLIRPVHSDGRLPAVMYFHGAGWVMGDATTHDRLVRELAVGAEALVVFVDYDRAPEARYPIAIEQAYAATRYVSDHNEELGVDETRLAIAGDSVGGNMAAVVALLAKQRSGPRIAGQLLFYPVTSANFETDSYKQFADGPWLTKAAMQWFWDQYLPDHSKRKEPTASPLLAAGSQLTGLPRTLIITAENDVLRDEGEAYGRCLIQAGVECLTTRYNATIHDFVMLNALATSAPSRAALTQATHFLREVLAQV